MHSCELAAMDEPVRRRAMLALVRHGAQTQLDSFNDLVTRGIARAVRHGGSGSIVMPDGRTITITLSDVRVLPPKTTASEAMAAASAHLLHVVATAAIVVVDTATGRVLTRVLQGDMPLFDLPCMIGSSLDPVDPGHRASIPAGSFVMRSGNVYSHILQEVPRYNHIFITDNVKQEWYGSSFTHLATMRSLGSATRSSATASVLMAASGAVKCTMQFTFLHPQQSSKRLLTFSVAWLFAALGVETHKELAALIDRPDSPSTTLILADFEPGVEAAISRIAALVPHETPASIAQKVETEVLPHARGPAEKAVVLGIMTRALLDEVSGAVRPCDQDHATNFTVECVGFMTVRLLRRELRKRIRIIIHRISTSKTCAPDWYSTLQDLRAIHGMLSCAVIKVFSGEPWFSGRREAAAVTQLLDRTNAGTVRQIMSTVVRPGAARAKVPKVRRLHPSHLGVRCPASTPDGENTSLRNELPVLARLRRGGVRPSAVRAAMTALGEGLFRPRGYVQPGTVLVCIDGRPVGSTPCADALRVELRRLRAAGIPSRDFGILWQPATFGVNVTLARNIPLMPAVPRGSMARLARSGGAAAPALVEWMSNLEIMTSGYTVASHPDAHPTSSHVAVHPLGNFGSIAAALPFFNFNQGPRTCYAAGCQGKSAISGVPGRGKFQLLGAQVPVVQTFVNAAIPATPTGQNLLIALSDWSGFTLEDAYVINRAAVQRGAMHVMRTAVVSEQSVHSKSLTTVFCNPLLEMRRSDPTKKKRTKRDFRNMRTPSAYAALQWNDTGLVRTRDRDGAAQRVDRGDVLIGRCRVWTDGEVEVWEDCSISAGRSHVGYISAATCGHTLDTGADLRTVHIRVLAEPTPGDKMAMRHGQKGTIGAVVPDEDMPFIEAGPDSGMAGLRPDLLISPCAMPTRMTPGVLLEVMASAIGLDAGRLANASALDAGVTPALIREALARAALGDSKDRPSKFSMCDGRTGERFEARIFCGFAFLSHLCHFAHLRASARAHGTVVPQSRQPSEGCGRGGGLRFGVMEFDAVHAHGAAEIAADKSCADSDGMPVYVCSVCKQVITTPRCPKPGCAAAPSPPRPVRIPFSTVSLFAHNAPAMGFSMRLDVAA